MVNIAVACPPPNFHVSLTAYLRAQPVFEVEEVKDGNNKKRPNVLVSLAVETLTVPRVVAAKGLVSKEPRIRKGKGDGNESEINREPVYPGRGLKRPASGNIASPPSYPDTMDMDVIVHV